MTKATVYYTRKENGRTIKSVIKYDHVTGMRAGTAAQVLGKADADGNGIPRNAPVIQFLFDDGNTATFNADNVTILF